MDTQQLIEVSPAIIEEVYDVVTSCNNISDLSLKWASEQDQYKKGVYSAALSIVTSIFLKQKMDSGELEYDQDSLNNFKQNAREQIQNLDEYYEE